MGKRKFSLIPLIWPDFYFYIKFNWYVICRAWVSHKVIWIKLVSLKFHAKMVQRYCFCLWRVLDEQELQPMSTYIGSLHERSRLPSCLLKESISDCDSIRFRSLWTIDRFWKNIDLHECVILRKQKYWLDSNRRRRWRTDLNLYLKAGMRRIMIDRQYKMIAGDINDIIASH